MRAQGDTRRNFRLNYTKSFERDETFPVDGEIVSQGTGFEDYFNAGRNGGHIRHRHRGLLWLRLVPPGKVFHTPFVA